MNEELGNDGCGRDIGLDIENPSAAGLGPVPEACEWIENELMAGMVLLPLSDLDLVWNQAHTRAISIVRNYARGEGLFQKENRRGRVR